MKLSELLKDVELPVKVIHEADESHRWVELRYYSFCSFYGHTKSGVSDNIHKEDAGYILYKEPKKQIKVYKYDYEMESGRWARSDDYFEDDEDFLSCWDESDNFKRRDDDFIMVDV